MIIYFIVRRALRDASKSALSGRRVHNTSVERALTTNFELLNLVPVDQMNIPKAAAQSAQSNNGQFNDASDDDSETLTKWRRVGLVSGSSVRLDTIIWPGGDIVVSGLQFVVYL